MTMFRDRVPEKVTKLSSPLLSLKALAQIQCR